MIRSDSENWRIRLSGWLDIGRGSDDDIRARLHVGNKFSKVDEVYTLVDFYPQSVKAGWALGYARNLTKSTLASMRYDFDREEFIGTIKQGIGRKWELRYEYGFDSRDYEIGARYKLHDFLSLEYIFDREENWLRIIGNF